jgi:hypothetical protein
LLALLKSKLQGANFKPRAQPRSHTAILATPSLNSFLATCGRKFWDGELRTRHQ